MLQLNNNPHRPRTLISVQAKFRCFDFNLILSNNIIANKLFSFSIRFKFHPHYYFLKLESKPNYYSSFSWKNNKIMFPSKVRRSIFKSLRRIKKKVTTTLQSPKKKNYFWKGRRIWVWILVAMTAAAAAAAVVYIQVIMQQWNLLFTLKFIYKASKYAISSGLLSDIYQALINGISSSLGVFYY